MVKEKLLATSFDNPDEVSRRGRPVVHAQKVQGFECRIEVHAGRYPYRWKVIRTDGFKDVQSGQSAKLNAAVTACNEARKDSIQRLSLPTWV